MATKADVNRLRNTLSDRQLFNHLRKEDPSFNDAVNRVQTANPNMTGIMRVKFPSAIINRHYFGKWILPQDVNTNENDATRQTSELIDRIDESSKGLFGRIKEDITTRGERFRGSLERQGLGEQGLPSTAFQLTGETVGGAFDVAGETLVSGFRALPDFIEEPIREGVSNVGQFFSNTNAGQSVLEALQQGAQAFEQLKESNPEVAENLRAIANIASVLPIARVGGVAKGARRTGKILEESGEAGILAQRRAFIDKLVSPVRTKQVKEAQVPRQKEVGIRRKTVTRQTPQEAGAAKALLDVEGLDPKRTVQHNFNIIQDANVAEAEALVKALKKDDFTFTRKEFASEMKKAKDKLKANPAIVGDAEKTAEKLIAEYERRVLAVPAKGSELLQVGKDYDIWVKSQKGANIFDPARENAFSIANREVRTAAKNFIDQKAVGVEVTSSKARQSALFDAMEIIIPKAALEADTRFLRSLQRMGEILGTKNRIVQGIGASVGLAGFGAAAAFAPAVAVVGGLGFLVYRGGRLVLSPKIRSGLGRAIKSLEKTGSFTEITVIRELLNQFE